MTTDFTPEQIARLKQRLEVHASALSHGKTPKTPTAFEAWVQDLLDAARLLDALAQAKAQHNLDRIEMIHDLRIAMHGASAAEHFSPKEMWELSIREVEEMRRERDDYADALYDIAGSECLDLPACPPEDRCVSCIAREALERHDSPPSR